jgi:hypothetical protein
MHSLAHPMNIPVMTGIIRRRILLNYRVAPETVMRILPANFQPKTVNGHAIAGICLIRLEKVRPKGFPSFAGASSENSAHRIAVEWTDAEGRMREGVYVPRRDTDSCLNALAGGRIFPGVHHHSKFAVSDADGGLSIRIETEGMDSPLVEIDAEESSEFPQSSVFASLEESSRFFEAGRIGYSSRPDSCLLDGLLLKVAGWKVAPLNIHRVRSVYYENRTLFPAHEIEFDHALIMRDIHHEWHSEPAMNAMQTHGKPFQAKAAGAR